MAIFLIWQIVAAFGGNEEALVPIFSVVCAIMGIAVILFGRRCAGWVKGFLLWIPKTVLRVIWWLLLLAPKNLRKGFRFGRIRGWNWFASAICGVLWMIFIVALV